MKRLSDTEAIVNKPYHVKTMSGPGRGMIYDSKAGANRNDYPACPDAGTAVTAREDIRGQLQYSYGGDSMDIAPMCKPSVGGEGLKSAIMKLNGGSLAKVRGSR